VQLGPGYLALRGAVGGGMLQHKFNEAKSEAQQQCRQPTHKLSSTRTHRKKEREGKTVHMFERSFHGGWAIKIK